MGFGGGGSGAAFTGVLPATTAEFTNSPVADDTDFGIVANTLRVYGQAFVLPATSKFYLITGLGWKNGATITDTLFCGLEKIGINTVPPTETALELVGYSTNIAQVGASAEQKNTAITQTRPLGKGDVVIGYIGSTTGTGTVRGLTVAAENSQRAITDVKAFPQWKPVTAWTAAVARYFMRYSFTGYG